MVIWFLLLLLFVVVVGPCLYFDSNKLVTKHNFCDYQGKLNMDRVLLEFCNNTLPLWCRAQYSALGDCAKLVHAWKKWADQKGNINILSIAVPLNTYILSYLI